MYLQLQLETTNVSHKARRRAAANERTTFFDAKTFHCTSLRKLLSSFRGMGEKLGNFILTPSIPSQLLLFHRRGSTIMRIKACVRRFSGYGVYFLKTKVDRIFVSPKNDASFMSAHPHADGDDRVHRHLPGSTMQ
jgi:hypothetical protein